MDEIKITVSDDLYLKLLDDKTEFGFGESKKNGFYSRALFYTYEYLTSKDRLERIKNILKESVGSKILSSVKEPELNEMARKINQKIQGSHYKPATVRQIYVRPTGILAPEIDRIICENNTQAASTTFRNILLEYISLPQYIREQLIFGKNYEVLLRAFKEKRKVLIKIDNGCATEYVMELFGLIRGKEEFHTYVTGYIYGENNTKELRALKLCTIQDAKIIEGTYSLSEEEKKEAGERIKQNPAFISGGYETVQVRFTDKGKSLYSHLYKDRPRYKEINGDIYTFECSVFQITNYLKSFGKEAVIINNSKIKNELKQFYLDALSVYSD